MRLTGSEWTESEDILLQSLWPFDLSTKEIASHFISPHKRTKSACIGRAHRLGLPRKCSPIKFKHKSENLASKRYCLNPECDREITAIGGHRDRIYCNHACANKVYALRNAADRELRPKKLGKDMPCLWNGCPHFALPGFHLCYVHGTGEVYERI